MDFSQFGHGLGLNLPAVGGAPATSAPQPQQNNPMGSLNALLHPQGNFGGQFGPQGQFADRFASMYGHMGPQGQKAFAGYFGQGGMMQPGGPGGPPQVGMVPGVPGSMGTNPGAVDVGPVMTLGGGGTGAPIQGATNALAPNPYQLPSY